MKRSVIATSIALVLIGFSVWALLNRQLIQDWMTVRRYTPSAQVSGLSQRTVMTKAGTFIFYASEPAVDDARTFNIHCGRQEAATAIIGCYTEGRIYIYQVDSKELDGIQEVTAAHEMLHAVWVRMSEVKQKQVGALLEKAYQRIKTPELEERMQYYEEHEPGERTNELHSILGTEVYPLGDDLERHYQEYFEDRSVVVSFHMGYQAVFSRLEAQATQLKGEIDMLAKSLNVDIANYNSSMEQLNLLTRRHNDQLTRINRTDRASVSSYNTESDRLRREQRSLADTKKEIDQRYAAYNDKIEAYNRIAVRSETLTNSIDSMRAPVEAAR